MYNKEYTKALKYAYQDHDNFLHSKLENIEDNLPHLVHADYLEERDKPATAQFIREVVQNRQHPDDQFNSHRVAFHSHVPFTSVPLKSPIMHTTFIPESETMPKLFPAKLIVHHTGFNPKTKLNDYVTYAKSGNNEELKDLYVKIKNELDN